jgi:hypothetical protein
MLKVEFIKIRFPEKINELRQRFFCLFPVISEFEMIPVNKFDVLHGTKIGKLSTPSYALRDFNSIITFTSVIL